MSSVPERGEVDEQYKWDLSDLFAYDEEWEEAFDEVEGRLEELESYEGRVLESAETLQEILELREWVSRRVMDIARYAKMRSDEDTTNQQYQALVARAQSLASQASSASSYFEPELQRADRDTLRAFVEENPALAEYDHYFDDVLRMKPHTRSPEVEELLAELSEVTGAASDVYNMLTNADMAFPDVEGPNGEPTSVTLSNFTKHMKHTDRDFRERVHATFYDEWANYRNAVGAAQKNSVKADVKLARARNYDTAREASLDASNVPVEVYDTLLETVREHLPLLHRHAELKADRLGVDTLEMWDLYAPLTDSESPDIPYEQAKEWVIEAVAPLGEAYQQRMMEGLESRWVDVYETRNKQSGAYSSGTYDSQPYILMNYQDDITSMFTLAHELGHSMHSDMTSETQPYVYSGYEIFVAEVASTVNESLLTHHLLSTVEDETFRSHLLDEYLERFRSTLFRQTMFADFEHQTHHIVENGGALTPDRLDEIYGDLKRDYYEPAHVDERIEREWMRIPHFYYSFYVYQYATGISAAVALTRDIVEEGEPAAARYREFLESGSRKYPLELLRDAGVDMATAAPIAAAMDTYEEYLAEFEALD
jgi:oligoendopeptidase F